jgi:molecular chaperone GrpE
MTERKRTQGGVEPNEPGANAAAPEEQTAPDEPDTEAFEAPRTAREAELEAELADTKERLLRALAETENLRRRNFRDLEEAHKYAITGFARELLEVADNLSRALDAVPPRAREEIEFVKNLADGVAMTEKALLACFERHKIAQVNPEIGEKFDHNRHQAMFEVATADHAPGTVAQVLQPGYTIAERLLRPALVAVAKGPANGPGAPGGDEAVDQAGDGRDEPGAAPGERVETTA